MIHFFCSADQKACHRAELKTTTNEQKNIASLQQKMLVKCTSSTFGQINQKKITTNKQKKTVGLREKFMNITHTHNENFLHINFLWAHLHLFSHTCSLSSTSLSPPPAQRTATAACVSRDTFLVVAPESARCRVSSRRLQPLSDSKASIHAQSRHQTQPIHTHQMCSQQPILNQ